MDGWIDGCVCKKKQIFKRQVYLELNIQQLLKVPIFL